MPLSALTHWKWYASAAWYSTEEFRGDDNNNNQR